MQSLTWLSNYYGHAIFALILMLALTALVSKVVRGWLESLYRGGVFVFITALWAFPLVVYGIGLLMPSLHTPVSWPIAQESRDGIMLIGAAIVIWLIIELVTTQYTDERRILISNTLVAAAWTIGFVYMVGYYSARQSIMWYQLLPAIGATIDLVAGIPTAILSAWNKNPTQVSGRRV